MMLSFGLTIVGAAYAGPATDVVKAKQTALYDLLHKPANETKIAATLDHILDKDAIAKGSHSIDEESRYAEEKAQCTDLLKQPHQKTTYRNNKKTQR